MKSDYWNSYDAVKFKLSIDILMEPWHVGLPGTKLLNKYRFNFTMNSYFSSALIPLLSTSSKLFTAHKMTYAMTFPVHTNLLKLVLKARKFDHLHNT